MTTTANGGAPEKDQPAVNRRFLPVGALCITDYKMQMEEILRKAAENTEFSTQDEVERGWR